MAASTRADGFSLQVIFVQVLHFLLDGRGDFVNFVDGYGSVADAAYPDLFNSHSA